MPCRYRHYLERAGGDEDMVRETLLHGTFFEEYKIYGFAGKSDSERREYLTDAVRDRICHRINGKEGQLTVTNKWLTYSLFHDHFKRQAWLLDNKTDLNELATQCRNYSKLVAKPVDNCGGRGVQLMTLADNEEWINIFKTLPTSKNSWIIEELIIQDETLARWNPDTVNTVRMNTLLRNGQVTHFYPFILTGRNGHFVNNGVQGGIFASINADNGIIITEGYDEMGHIYEKHPDSGTPFRREQLPDWNQLMEITTTMAKCLPDVSYIGWDMAHTSEGWICVEANKGEFVAQQTSLGRGLRKEFEKLTNTKDINENEDSSMKYLIVGLGNIGDEYESTRHNSGFMVIDRLLKAYSAEKNEKPSYILDRHAYRAEMKWKGRTMILIRPTTYMNLSGKAVQYWMQKEKIQPENLLVIVDDIALPVGKIRMKKQGSNGGHNGLANIDDSLHTSNYARLRIGVGNNFGHGHQIDYVLGHFTDEELSLLDPALNRAVDAVKAFVTLGPDRTMNMYN